MAEMGTIGRTHHINLVRLYGFCFDANATRALVYEFMPNGSLDDYLSSARRAGAEVSMTTVAAIATGVARGLRYLHEECQHKIVHYDIKPGNVLLDADMNGKLCDFGLARLYDHGTDPHTTHVVGTMGYLAPEYMLTGRATEATDVFSFGALVLELMTGQARWDEASVSWARGLIRDGKGLDIVDPRVHGGEAAARWRSGWGGSGCAGPSPPTTTVRYY